VADGDEPKVPEGAKNPPAADPADVHAPGPHTVRRKIGSGPGMANATVPPGLDDPEQRERWGLPTNDEDGGWYMVELNLMHREGLELAGTKFEKLYKDLVGDKHADDRHQLVRISRTYFRIFASVAEWRRLIREDEKAHGRADRVVYKLWPDFPVKPLIDRSIATVKADAAFRSYAADGSGVCWAVIDSGIDRTHSHFGGKDNPSFATLTDPSVVDLHRDFTVAAHPTKDTRDAALIDRFGHGTHVAGIIAGGLDGGPDVFKVYENVYVGTGSEDPGAPKETTIQPRKASPAMRGVAPQCKLVSLKVLDDEGNGKASDVIRAMQYIRDEVNGDPKVLRIHGVNLSIGYEFDAEMFACGQSPLCLEVDRLSKAGVVVVVAAGNTGYGKVGAQQRATRVSLSNTINDPGNSRLAITVGATHRDMPHMYGVSYFSSKGPTGDGRLKPDLVAPGERITSCASGKYLKKWGGDIPDEVPAYIDDTGTSMAAPHVSGAIAAFLSIRREFVLRPDEVKRIFMESATPLGRERYFEGRGLLDLMRAIQSV
jgi:serine protease AprX